MKGGGDVGDDTGIKMGSELDENGSGGEKAGGWDKDKGGVRIKTG